MAKRPFYTDLASETSGRAFVDLEFITAADGTVATTGRHRGIATVAKSGTGLYTVTFNDSYVALISWDLGVIQAAAYDKTKAVNVRIQSDDVDNAAAPIIILGVTDGDGDLINAVLNDVVKGTFTLQWNNASQRGVNV